MRSKLFRCLLLLTVAWSVSERLIAQRYNPDGLGIKDSIAIERIIIERPANFKQGDILIPKGYAQELQRAADSLKTFVPRYDSLILKCDLLQLSLRRQQAQADSSFQVHYQQREDLLREIYALGLDAVQSQDLLYADIGSAKQRKKALERNKRTGFFRELLFHPATTPKGRLLLGGMTLSFTALTIATIVSLTKN